MMLRQPLLSAAPHPTGGRLLQLSHTIWQVRGAFQSCQILTSVSNPIPRGTFGKEEQCFEGTWNERGMGFGSSGVVGQLQL